MKHLFLIFLLFLLVGCTNEIPVTDSTDKTSSNTEIITTTEQTPFRTEDSQVSVKRKEDIYVPSLETLLTP